MKQISEVHRPYPAGNERSCRLILGSNLLGLSTQILYLILVIGYIGWLVVYATYPLKHILLLAVFLRFIINGYRNRNNRVAGGVYSILLGFGVSSLVVVALNLTIFELICIGRDVAEHTVTFEIAILMAICWALEGIGRFRIESDKMSRITNMFDTIFFLICMIAWAVWEFTIIVRQHGIVSH